MNKKIPKKRIFILFLMIFGFYSLVFGQEKKLSFWVKGGVLRAMSYDAARKNSTFPITKTLPFYGKPSVEFGIEISKKNWFLELAYTKADLGYNGYRILVDGNLNGFSDETSILGSSLHIPAYSVNLGYMFGENNNFSIAPKLGYQFRRYYCLNYEVSPDVDIRNSFYVKEVCINPNGHNINLGLEIKYRLLPSVKRGNSFFSIQYSQGLNELSKKIMKFYAVPIGTSQEFKDTIEITRISKSFFLKIGYQFKIYQLK